MPQKPSQPVRSPHEKFFTGAEWLIAMVGLLVLAKLKWLYLYALKVNSDEPQHLHVAWSWTQGLVQYRDFFDNHTPLFHLLSAPVIHWFGERADIILYMRLTMIPIVVAALGCIFLITRRLYNTRAAVWAALLAGLHPFYLLVSTEYRTDNFWALCWFIVLTWLLTGAATAKRFFIAGLFIGAAFAVSLKTSLLLLSFGLAAALVLAARIWAGEKALWKRIVQNTLAALGGAIIIPAILLAYFASENALEAMAYCVFEHNIVPGMQPKGDMIRWSFPLRFPLIIIAGWLFYHTAPNRALGTRRAVALMGAALSMTLLMAYWPLVTRQDFAAIAPPFFISLAPLLVEIMRRLRKSGCILLAQGRTPKGAALVALALLLPMALIAYEVKGNYDTWRWTHAGLATFEHHLKPKLAISKPGDYFFDAKGEVIFRRRPYYFVLERVTLTRLKRDLMENTIRHDVLSKNTTVICFSRIPRSIERELDDHYLRVVDSTWVAGKLLNKHAFSAPGEPLRFTIPIPGRYTLISADGVMPGTLDGEAVNGPVELTKGEHAFIPADPTKKIAVVITQALDAGYDPFHVPMKVKVPKSKKQVILTNPFSRKKSDD